jgi:hypothetical protein
VRGVLLRDRQTPPVCTPTARAAATHMVGPPFCDASAAAATMAANPFNLRPAAAAAALAPAGGAAAAAAAAAVPIVGGRGGLQEVAEEMGYCIGGDAKRLHSSLAWLALERASRCSCVSGGEEVRRGPWAYHQTLHADGCSLACHHTCSHVHPPSGTTGAAWGPA